MESRGKEGRGGEVIMRDLWSGWDTKTQNNEWHLVRTPCALYALSTLWTALTLFTPHMTSVS